MTIAEAREKCKGLLARIPRDVLIIAVLLSASSASFALGYMAAPVPDIAGVLSQPSETEKMEALNGETTSAAGRFVASKNGTKYYLPSCSGAERISESNKVWFASAAAASAAGYAPAANCKGL